MRTIQEKREAAQLKIEQTAAMVQQSIAKNDPAYIVRARRNAYFIAQSNAAMLEAFIMLEKE